MRTGHAVAGRREREGSPPRRGRSEAPGASGGARRWGVPLGGDLGNGAAAVPPASLGVAAGLSEGHGESCGAGRESGVGQESGAGRETVVPGVTCAPVRVPLSRRRSRVCGAVSRSGLY